MTSPIRDDLLDRAARALHAEAHDDAVDGVEAWQAMHGWRDVSRDVRRAARRRRIGLIVAAQLVAALVGVGAWAAVSGRLPALFSRLAPAAPAAPAPAAPHAHRAHARRAAPRPPTAAETAPSEEKTPVAIEAPAAAEAAPTVAAPRPAAPAPAARAAVPANRPRPPAPPTPAAAPAPPPAAPPLDREDLYRQAHHAHFVLRDHAAALALWDKYLASGGGSLMLEARYNRAIALVRLGQREAAVAALKPFAAGENDGYRQEEAQALLRRLEAPPP